MDDNLRITPMFVTVFVVILVVGTLSMFAFTFLLNQTDDPHRDSHDYTVEGTIDGVEYTGTGASKYTPESTNYYNYQFDLVLADSSGNTRTVQFGMQFTRDDRPDSSLYTYVGESTVGDIAVTIWHIDDHGIGYTFYVSENCIVEYAEISDGSMDLVLTISR